MNQGGGMRGAASQLDNILIGFVGLFLFHT